MWWPQDLETWAKVASDVASALSTVITLFAGIIAALWAYTKFVIERGLLPGVQFNVELATVGEQGDKKLVEILLHLKNVGSSTLVVKNLRIDMRYLDDSAELSLFKSGNGFIGKVVFPNSLRKDMKEGKVPLHETEPASTVRAIEQKRKEDKHREGIETRGFPLLDHNTFVLPAVDQIYTFTTAIPRSATYVLSWASFEYAVAPTRTQTAILFLSRRLGLIQYSLTHIEEPHTHERVFKV